MADNQTGWGIIGASSWADHTFAPAIAAAGNATLRTVLSSGQEKADAFCQKHGVERGYDNLNEFLDDDSIEAVWITSPNYLHAEQAVAALRHGKHVLCEKPMAISATDCERMIEAAEESGKVFSIGYHMRQHPLHQELQKQWSEGAFGKPVCVRAQLYYAYPEAPGEWRQKKDTSGGWAICDVGTHLIDLLRWFLGDAENVHGELSSPRFGFETDDHAVVDVRFANGALGVADASTGAGAAGPRLELYGDEGYCICEGTLFGGGGTVTKGRGNEEPEVSQAPEANLYQLQVEAFSRAVQGDGDLLVTADDGLQNVKIIEQARGW